MVKAHRMTPVRKKRRAASNAVRSSRRGQEDDDDNEDDVERQEQKVVDASGCSRERRLGVRGYNGLRPLETGKGRERSSPLVEFLFYQCRVADIGGVRTQLSLHRVRDILHRMFFIER